jgi:hypothetical protein
MSDYHKVIENAQQQLLANIEQAQELNLAAVGVLRALAQFAVPPAADQAVGDAGSQAAAAAEQSLEFTSKLMKLQGDYAARLLAELSPAPDKG